jgi:hypothetical protein
MVAVRTELRVAWRKSGSGTCLLGWLASRSGSSVDGGEEQGRSVGSAMGGWMRSLIDNPREAVVATVETGAAVVAVPPTLAVDTELPDGDLTL